MHPSSWTGYLTPRWCAPILFQIGRLALRVLGIVVEVQQSTLHDKWFILNNAGKGPYTHHVIRFLRSLWYCEDCAMHQSLSRMKKKLSDLTGYLNYDWDCGGPVICTPSYSEQWEMGELDLAYSGAMAMIEGRVVVTGYVLRHRKRVKWELNGEWMRSVRVIRCLEMMWRLGWIITVVHRVYPRLPACAGYLAGDPRVSKEA